MTPQSWAACPFCRSVHQITEHTRQITIDGTLRFVCTSCALASDRAHQPKGNGDASGRLQQ